MAKTLTAADRKALIRLASSMEAGSQERRAILAGLTKTAGGRDVVLEEMVVGDHPEENEGVRMVRVTVELDKRGRPSGFYAKVAPYIRFNAARGDEPPFMMESHRFGGQVRPSIFLIEATRFGAKALQRAVDKAKHDPETKRLIENAKKQVSRGAKW